jgi:hypothetical protein
MVPSYFNAGHHLPVFQVAAYLRRRRPDCEVTAIDASALNSNWRDAAALLARGFDVIALMNDYDGVDGLPRFVRYARELSPGARLITFGRLSKQVPGWFERLDLDAIVTDGDVEAAVGDYLDLVPAPAGVALRQGDRWLPAAPGRWLPPAEWAFPDPSEIPYAAYDRLYADDLRKFCGIPDRRELVVPIARGCPIGCSFCEVPWMQGSRERRLPVADAVDYIDRSFQAHPFEYVSFYAPTFTLDRSWVLALCDAPRFQPQRRPWKCATTMRHLDEELVMRMGAAGCVRISVGIETLFAPAASGLPRAKRYSLDELRRTAAWCRAAGIELNCFVILGMPGDSPEAARATIEQVRAEGARVRTTILTRYDRIGPDADLTDIGMHSRQLFADASLSREEREGYYRLQYGLPDDRPTAVAGQIPQRATTRLKVVGSMP